MYKSSRFPFNKQLALRGLILLPFALLFFSASPAHANTCPVFSQPNGPGDAAIKVTYGKCALVPATATVTTGGTAGVFWEIAALYPFNPGSCPADIVPMPAWISFEPISGPESNSTTFKMTIDPTKGGGVSR